jgi:recombinational DNA repair protein (RecF pathway)
MDSYEAGHHATLAFYSQALAATGFILQLYSCAAGTDPIKT